MLDSVAQVALFSHVNLVAVVNHKIDLLSADPNPAVRAEFEDIVNSGYQFYHEEKGNYDYHALSWFCDEFFYQGAFFELNIADKQQFVEHYMKYSNGTSARYRISLPPHTVYALCCLL